MNAKSFVVVGAIVVLLACARPIIAADDEPGGPTKAADNDVNARGDSFMEYRAKTTSDGWKRGAIARTLALTEVIDHNKPVGSIDAHATVRVVDVQGDMLQVSHAGISGWVDSRTVVDVSDLLGLLSLRKEAAEQALQQALAAAGKALDPQTFETAASWSERLRDASLAFIENVPPMEGLSQAQWVREKQDGLAAVHRNHRDRVSELARLSAAKVKLGLARETDLAVARYYLSAAEIALTEAESAGRVHHSSEPAHDEPRGPAPAPAEDLPQSSSLNASEIYVLAMPDVQKELKLSESQAKRIAQALDEFLRAAGGFGNFSRYWARKQYDHLPERMRPVKMSGWGDFRSEAERAAERERIAGAKEIADRIICRVLSPGQRARLFQLSLQSPGAFGLIWPRVAEELGMTIELQATLASIHERAGLDRPMHPSSTEEERRGYYAMMAELERQTESEMLSALTEEQRAKFTKMKGKPFVFPSEPSTGRKARSTADREAK